MTSLAPIDSLWIKTPLGSMMALGDLQGLLFLNFVEKSEEPKILSSWGGDRFFSGRSNSLLDHLQEEIEAYFQGTLQSFGTPLQLKGTPFQTLAWETLQRIKYGTTLSYAEQARQMASPKGCRAVAQANGKNKIVLLIPCHRIIQSDGKLGGYSSGLERKSWLLAHERKYAPSFS